jgi:cystathionine gamma-synthase
MVVLNPNTTEFGHSVPPETNHSITTNVPGWDTAVKVREGDLATISRVVHIYPRFMPWRSTREVNKGAC